MFLRLRIAQRKAVLHSPDDGGEILLAATGCLFRVNSCGCFCSRHRKSQARRLSQNESEVLTHESNGELRCVVVPLGGSQFASMRLSDNRGLGQCVEQKLTRQAQSFAQGYASAMACIPSPRRVLTTSFMARPEPLGPM